MTVDLLATLDEDTLRFTPGPGLGPLWRQFRHLGRIEDNYTLAIGSGQIAFGPPRRRSSGTSAEALQSYVHDLDRDLEAAVAGAPPGLRVDWGSEVVDLAEHVGRLVNHEVLHHGELIAYVRMLGRPFPAAWRIWGL
jgi:DinB superfamily